MEEQAKSKRAAEAEALRNELIELETQQRLLEMQKQTELARREIHRQFVLDNERLAREKVEREAAEKAKEAEVNRADLTATSRSRMINEDLIPRNASRMDYRGMTVAEQKQILDEQHRQIAERQARREAEKKKEAEWEEYQEQLRAEGDAKEAKWRRQMAEERKKLQSDHLVQAAESKATRQHMLKRDLYGDNAPDESYHNQWARYVR
jgi:hypothetical protein